jgi:precorrin-6B methylase 2
MPLGAPRPDPIAYLSQVAASSQGRAIRAHILAALDLRAGQVALDVGCGLVRISVISPIPATGTGRVIGVDNDPGSSQARMAEARLLNHPAADLPCRSSAQSPSRGE